MAYREKKFVPRRNHKMGLLSCLILAGMLCGCAGGDFGDKAERDIGGSEAVSESGDLGAEPDQSAGEEDAATALVFEAQDMEGNTVTSDIFGQSKLTMINVWATYCNPCLSEMPDLGELAGEYDADQFRIIGIISDVAEETKGEDSEKAQKARDGAADLIERTGADYTHLLLNVSLYKALLTDVTAVPTTFFVDEEGNVLGQVLGARDKESWKKMIDKLLEEL